MPKAYDMYRIHYGTSSQGVTNIGNPSLEIPRTIAYELGFEYNLLDMLLIRTTGYYKDVSDQTATVSYTNYDASVDYSIRESNNYADIRGFEFEIRKDFGWWVTGWFNYDYMVTTSGYVGRQHYYQDPRLQTLYGWQNPYQERPLARPVARGNIRFMTPQNWGPTFAGIKPLGGWSFNLLYSYRAGQYQDWDPLGLDLPELRDNLQWKGYHNWDARITYDLKIGRTGTRVYADIQNLFNIEHFNPAAFDGAADRELYLESLHLSMYAEEGYEEYTAGDDKPGDIRSDDKPYINMPNRNFLLFTDQRFVTFGIMFSL